MRYGELERWTEMPNAPMFSAHLKKMIRDGLITRNVKALGPPAVVFYELTPLGHSLSAPAYELLSWISANKTKVFEARMRSRSDSAAV
jgi:DNA-binding HxlR family transcriptional regulator